LLGIFIGHRFDHERLVGLTENVSFTYRNRKRHGKSMALLPEKEMDQLDCPFTDWINKEARKKKSQHQISTSQQ